MITLNTLTLQRGTKLLVDQASLTVFAKQKIGIVGVNGCGKSSLFGIFLQKLHPDGGEVFVQKNISIAYLAQEVPHGEISAVQYVMQGDKEITSLTQELQKAEATNNHILITELHNKLYGLDGYALEAKACKILNGLGFKVSDYQKEVNAFSGGWRMRLNLAQVLLSRAELLLLDEPTNYLDMDAMVWLEKWLQNYDGTLLLISHDREFLDNVVNRIVHIENCKIETYTGNYSSFEEQRAEKLAQEKSLYEKQQAKIAHMQKYIDRFRAKASKARQAQSRMKLLEKMEKVTLTHLDTPFTFKFAEPKSCSPPLITMEEVSLGYGDKTVIRSCNFSLNPEDRIGVLGINGAGKSTFMKSLAGILRPQRGNLFSNKDIQIGYFAQHQIDQLSMQDTPFHHITRIDPKATEQQVRTFLGGFDFSNDTIFRPITNFSGGEKARLVLALLIWQKPNLLLLDEPTNHLDLETREALSYALQEYTGALVLVAHDRHLLKATVDEFYLVNNGEVTQFRGDLDDYQRWLLDAKKTVEVVQKEEISKPQVSHKHLRQLEKKLEKLYNERDALAAKLLDPQIYQKENRAEFEKCSKRSAILEDEIKQAEEEWLS
ncbi:MAG: ATP-binding cassette domain-containing protein [Gammaproteobacteria bacterium]